MRLVSNVTSASVEFAEFLADVSDSATGMIRSDRLAWWLGVPEEAVIASWRGSCLAWEDFAANVLAVLDAFQDLTFSLSQSLAWYRVMPLLCGSGKTAADYVAEGRVAFALGAVRQFRRGQMERPPDAATG
jgi:hypothetical protein